jgi:uncharacterized protein (DUF362 family)
MSGSIPYRVGLFHARELAYSTRAPFDPPDPFPEIAHLASDLDPTNSVYRAVRSLLAQLGYDRENYGTSRWNPLGWLVKPGDRVFIKPNLIAERSSARDEWESVITHGSILRAVVDYVTIALNGNGILELGDAPQTDSDIERIKKHLGIASLVELCERRSVTMRFLDLRDEYWPSKDGVVTSRQRLPGDPFGSTLFNLDELSYLAEVDHLDRRYYGAFYDVDQTNRHHSRGRHAYKIANSPLTADVFISLPKLKTHKKVGVTINLKGLVGINADKNYLPHYALGAPAENGDQFPDRTAATRAENLLVLRAKRLLKSSHPLAVAAARRMKPLMYRIFGNGEQTVRAGNWWGNDTCWRMSLDLNRILLYGRSDGTLGTERKRYFSLVDGVVAMEGNGPVGGNPKSVGTLIAGENPAAVDAVAARIMGFDPMKLAIVARAFDDHRFPIASGSPGDVEIVSELAQFRGSLRGLPTSTSFAFQPHFAWKGRIEVGR